LALVKGQDCDVFRMEDPRIYDNMEYGIVKPTQVGHSLESTHRCSSAMKPRHDRA